MATNVNLGGGAVLAIAGVVVVGIAAWKLYGVVGKTADKAAAVAKEVVTKDLNPASDDNLANRAVLSVGRAITGDPSWSLGGWIYDVTHPAPAERPPTASYDETERLLARYPNTTAPDKVFTGGLTFSEQVGLPL